MGLLNKKSKLFATIIFSTAILVGCGSITETKESLALAKTSTNSQPMMTSEMKIEGMMNEFEGVDNHKVSGIIKIANDTLKLTAFKTDDGPDLLAYLTQNEKVDEGKDFGEIDLTEAEQTFDISGINLDKDNSALLYGNKAPELFGKTMFDAKWLSLMNNRKKKPILFWEAI